MATYGSTTAAARSGLTAAESLRANVAQPSASSRSSHDASQASGGAALASAAVHDSDEREELYSSHASTWRSRLHAFYDRNFGLFLVFVAQSFGSVMSTAAKLLTSAGAENQLSALHIIFVRMLVTAVLGMSYMWYKKVPDFPFGPRAVWGLLVLRGFAGFTGLFGLYYSLSVLEISDAVVITFLVPTFTALVCFIWLREPYTPKEAAAGFIALIGVLLVARPPFIFGKKATEPITATSAPLDTNTVFDAASMTMYSTHDFLHVTLTPRPSPAERGIAVLVAILGTFAAALAYSTIRVIGKRAHSLVSVNAFALIATVGSAVVILVHPDLEFVWPQGWVQWTLLAVIGVAGFLLQFLLTEGLQREKAGRATNLTYLQLVFTLIVERVIWGTTPPPISLVGSALIIGAAVWISLQKNTTRGPAPGTGVKEPATTREGQGEVPVTVDEETALLGPREEDVRR